MHQFGPPISLHIEGPFYVGIGFCSHLPDKSDTTVLSNVVFGKLRRQGPLERCTRSESASISSFSVNDINDRLPIISHEEVAGACSCGHAVIGPRSAASLHRSKASAYTCWRLGLLSIAYRCATRARHPGSAAVQPESDSCPAAATSTTGAAAGGRIPNRATERYFSSTPKPSEPSEYLSANYGNGWLRRRRLRGSRWTVQIKVSSQ
jgi:hypothetical protein